MSNKLRRGVNDLATVAPDIALQWHPTKNGNLAPSDITAGNSRKVWWLYPYDDPVTGRHFDFEWEASISNRVKKKSGCPYLGAHQQVWTGFNDLATVNPEIATKNLIGNFTVFMPMGFYLPLFMKNVKSNMKYIVTVLVILVCTEILKLIMMSGSFNIDDMILNLAGAMIGYMICQTKAVKKLIKKLK